MLGWNRAKAEYDRLKSLLDEISEDMKSLAKEVPDLFKPCDSGHLPNTH